MTKMFRSKLFVKFIFQCIFQCIFIFFLSIQWTITVWPDLIICVRTIFILTWNNRNEYAFFSSSVYYSDLNSFQKHRTFVLKTCSIIHHTNVRCDETNSSTVPIGQCILQATISLYVWCSVSMEMYMHLIYAITWFLFRFAYIYFIEIH